MTCLAAVLSCGEGPCLFEALGHILGEEAAFNLQACIAASAMERVPCAEASTDINPDCALSAVSLMCRVQVLVHAVVHHGCHIAVMNRSHPSAPTVSTTIHLLCDASQKYHALIEVPLRDALGFPQLWPQPCPALSDGHMPLWLTLDAPGPEALNNDALKSEVANFVEAFLSMTENTNYIDVLELVSRQARLRHVCERWAFPCRAWALLVYECPPWPDVEVAAFAHTVLGGSQVVWTRGALLSWQRRLRKMHRGKALPCPLWRDLIYRADVRTGRHPFKIKIQLSDFLH